MFRGAIAGHEDEAERRRARMAKFLRVALILVPPVYFAARRSWVAFAISVGLFILAIICAMLGRPWQNAIGLAYVQVLWTAVLHGYR